MPIDFPNNPSAGQTYSYGGQRWQYNGVAWDKIITATIPLGGICGSIQYNDGASGLSGNSNFYYDGTNVVLVDPTHLDGDILGGVHHYAHNNSGVGITRGWPVYITGMDGASTIIRIATADASNSSKMPAIGLAESDIADGAFGHVIMFGTMLQTDTSAYATNQTLYVAPGGGLTSGRPSASNQLIQNIGKVGRVHPNTGSLIVMGPGRSNDVPNIVPVRSWLEMPSGQTATSIVTLFNGLSGPVTGVGSVLGLTGAVGITNGSGIGLSVSGQTMTFSNTGVLSFNGLTGAVTGVTTGTANTFGPLQSFTNGISSAGGTFSSLVRFNAGISAAGGITFNSDVTINSVNTLYVAKILSPGYGERISIGDYDGIGNGTFLYVRDNVYALDIANPYGLIKIGDVQSIDTGSYISYEAQTHSLYGNGGNIYNFYQGSFSGIVSIGGLLTASAGISAAGATLSSLTTIPSGATLSVRGNITGNVVNLINGITGAVNLAAGSNITITPSGLTLTIAAGAGFSRSINVITTSTTAGATSNVDYVYIGNTSGNINLTLPTAVSNANRYTVKNSNIGILTVLTTSSQTIDGVTGYSLSKQFQAIDLLSDNSNWVVV